MEKLDIEKGKPVVFDKVLLTYDESAGATIGAPYIEGVRVQGTVLEQGKNPKIIVFKYKAKKRYRKKTGHRQPFTLVKITSVGGGKEVKTKPVRAKTAKAPKKAKPVAKSKKPATRSKTKARV